MRVPYLRTHRRTRRQPALVLWADRSSKTIWTARPRSCIISTRLRNSARVWRPPLVILWAIEDFCRRAKQAQGACYICSRSPHTHHRDLRRLGGQEDRPPKTGPGSDTPLTDRDFIDFTRRYVGRPALAGDECRGYLGPASCSQGWTRILHSGPTPRCETRDFCRC